MIAQIKTQESIVEHAQTSRFFVCPLPLSRPQILRLSPPYSSLPFILITMITTRYTTFGYKTGEEMDKYMGDDIKYDNITTFGTYDKNTDDVTLTLCPKACGGPIIGHLEDVNGDCKRHSSPNHKALTDDESLALINNIKHLSNWNKAKLMWTTDPTSCTCDICKKKCLSQFHLYDHLKTDHNFPNTMIKTKILAIQSKVAVPNTLEDPMKLLVTSGRLHLLHGSRF